MSKIKDFFAKAFVEDAAKKEIIEILSEKKLVEATDDQLAKISEVAKKLGVDITAEELKEFANGSMELDDEELDAVSGGWDEEGRPTQFSEWHELARQLDKVMKDRDDFQETLRIISEKHNLREWEVFDNWCWFSGMGLL